MGGVFGDFFSRLVRPHFKHEMQLAKASGDDVWAIQARKDRFLDRWSVIIARYNARAVQCAVLRDGVAAGAGMPMPPARVDVPDDLSDAGTELGAATNSVDCPSDDEDDLLASVTRHHDDGVSYVDGMVG